MATLKDLIELKEIYARKSEQAQDAVKFYEEEISKKVKEIENSKPKCYLCGDIKTDNHKCNPLD